MDKIIIDNNESGQRLDRYISKYYKDLSFVKIQKMIRSKDIKVNNARTQNDYRLQPGDVLSVFIYNNLNSKPKQAEEFESYVLDKTRIVYEDDNILIYNKLAAQSSQFSYAGCNLTEGFKNYLTEKGEYDPVKNKTFSPSFINRLDTNTLGLMIGAKNYQSAKYYSMLSRENKIKKYYTAVLYGKRPQKMIYKAYIKKDSAKKIAIISDVKKEGYDKIITTVEDVNSNSDLHLCKILLNTGKFHQIRAHMAHLKSPVVADYKYGISSINEIVKRRYNAVYQLLIANELVIPVGDEIKVINVNIPDLFYKVFEKR